jgi:hypothetical protein
MHQAPPGDHQSLWKLWDHAGRSVPQGDVPIAERWVVIRVICVICVRR